MTDAGFQLADVPDLTGVGDTFDRTEPFADGWYKGVILEKREFVDATGNTRVFTSGDEPAQRSGRNIRLQVTLQRQSDNRTLNISALTNYLPDDLTQETVQKVIAQQERVKSGEEWGDLFRAFMSLNRLSKLQKIAGVRQFSRNGNGGLDLQPLYNKTAYFRIKPDSRNDKYKEIADYSTDAPKRAKVL